LTPKDWSAPARAAEPPNAKCPSSKVSLDDHSPKSACRLAAISLASTGRSALNVHPDTVRCAIEVERFQHAEPLTAGGRKAENLPRKWTEVQLDESTCRVVRSETGRRRVCRWSIALFGRSRATSGKPKCAVQRQASVLVRHQEPFQAACKRAGITNLRSHDRRSHGPVNPVPVLPRKFARKNPFLYSTEQVRSLLRVPDNCLSSQSSHRAPHHAHPRSSALRNRPEAGRGPEAYPVR